MQRSPRAAIAVLLAVTLWSLGFPLTEIALQSASPALLSVTRFALTSALLLPFAIRDPTFRPVLMAPRTIVLGLTGVALYYGLSHTALELSTAGTIAIAGSLSPAITALVAKALLRERLRTRDLIALVLATAGVGAVSITGFRIDAGVPLFVVAMTSYAVYTVLLRRRGVANQQPSALVIATTTFIWGTVLLAPWPAIEVARDGLQPPTWIGWAMVVVLAVVVTAPAAVLYSYGAARLPAMVTGILTAVGPPMGYVFSLAFGEAPDPVKIGGGLVAVVGVVIAVLPRKRPPTEEGLA